LVEDSQSPDPFSVQLLTPFFSHDGVTDFLDALRKSNPDLYVRILTANECVAETLCQSGNYGWVEDVYNDPLFKGEKNVEVNLERIYHYNCA
jgi:hypothetical protein